MFGSGNAPEHGTLARILARELTPEELEAASGGGTTVTVTCSDETVTDCDTDTKCH